MAAHLSMVWTDTQLQWKPNLYGGISLISLDKDKVWRPTLSQYAQPENQDGPMSATVWLDSGGHVFWAIAGLFYTRCSIDVFSYPFDKHECDFTFMSMRYNNRELLVDSVKNKVNTDNFIRNGEWELGTSTCESVEHRDGIVVSGISCKITIKRRPAFCIIHMGLPLIFLTVLTLLVFWVPVDCVERISLSVTLFLAFSVLVSGLTTEIPRNSDQLPLYSILLIFLNVFSSTSVGVSILVVRLSLKTETNIPDCVVKLVVIFHKGTDARIHPEKGRQINTEENDQEIKDSLPLKTEKTKYDITWLDVACFVDRLAFIIMTAALGFMILAVLFIAFI